MFFLSSIQCGYYTIERQPIDKRKTASVDWNLFFLLDENKHHFPAFMVPILFFKNAEYTCQAGSFCLQSNFYFSLKHRKKTTTPFCSPQDLVLTYIKNYRKFEIEGLSKTL